MNLFLIILSVLSININKSNTNTQEESLYYYVSTYDMDNKRYFSQVLKFTCEYPSRFYSSKEDIESSIQLQYLDHLRTKEFSGYMAFRFVNFYNSSSAASNAKRKEIASIKSPKNKIIEDFNFQFYCAE